VARHTSGIVTGDALVGIIANPASGKDIRRLVAHGSAFDNNEKINIVRRVLLGLDAAGVSHVAHLPDDYGIVQRAAHAAKPKLQVSPLQMPVIANATDSTEAAQRLRDAGAAVIITLGGDGTNRVVAKGCGDVPLLPISTGTNNVFPRMIEGTLAGLAAGLIATGVAINRPDGPTVIRRLPRLEIFIDDQFRDIALIDAVTSRQSWIGARAIWEPTHLREVALSRLIPAAIGIASIGSPLFPAECGTCNGAFVRIGTPENATSTITVPIAPGLIRQIHVADAQLMHPGEMISFAPGPCTIALDGEREIEVRDARSSLAVRLQAKGPRIIDVEATLTLGASLGAFRS
jgi:predicted polyphosphate/ATP-dependent NAD kinase